MSRDRFVHCEISVAAPPDKAWSAWTDPARLVEWDPDRVDGALGPGASARFHWDHYGVARDLEVTAWEPPHRLVLQSPTEPAQSLELELSARGDETLVSVSFGGFRDADERAGAEAGWTAQLAVLRHYLEHHFASPRRIAAAAGPLAASREDVFERVGTPAGLASWLGDVSIAADGDWLAVHTPDGPVLGGAVLATAAPHELVLASEDLGGILRLRCLPLAGARWTLAAAVLSTWNADAASHLAAEVALRAAMTRLVGDLGGPAASA